MPDFKNEKKHVSANRVKAVQYELGLSDDQMAKILGVTKFQFWYKIRGQRRFTLDDIETIQALCGKPFDYLFE